MMKILSTAACAAVLAVAGNSFAADISNDTLAAMGLSGATIVSDAEASEVRGMGYMGGNSFSLSAGGSIAYVGGRKAGAGSANVYLQKGTNATGGENFSEAGRTMTTTKRVKVGPVVKRTTTTKSIRVYAGGFSSGYAY